MNKTKSKVQIGLSIVSAVLLLSACGQSTSTPASSNAPSSQAPSSKPKPTSNEPVTLTWYANTVPAVSGQLNSDPLFKKKFPNVTIEYHPTSELAKSIAAGDPIDMINVLGGQINDVKNYGLAYGIDGLIKSHNLNMDVYNKNDLASFRAYSDKGELYGLPRRPDPYASTALLYNKNLFDKFAVPYPDKYMTWSHTIELAKRLTRTDGGVKYKGLMISFGLQRMNYQLGATLVDATGKVLVESDPKIRQMMEVMQNAYAANDGELPQKVSDANWIKEKNIAMYAGTIYTVRSNPDAGFDWDISYYPAFGDHSVEAVEPGVFMVTSVSKHKDLAFDVLAWLTSDDEKHKADAATWDKLKGKNLKAIDYKSGITKAVLAPGNKYGAKAATIWSNNVDQMLQTGADINTTLRNTASQLETMVNTVNSASKK